LNSDTNSNESLKYVFDNEPARIKSKALQKDFQQRIKGNAEKNNIFSTSIVMKKSEKYAK